MRVIATGTRVIGIRQTFNDGVEQLESGLFIAKDKEQHYDEPMVLRVVSVGPKVKGEISVNDEIITRGMAGADVRVGEQDYISLVEEDVLATLRYLE